MPTPLMLAQRLAPDDLRSQFQPYRPDVLPTGEPMPGAGEDATKIWGQMAHNLAQPTDWGGIGSEYANALLMGSTAPGMRGGPGFRAFHGSPHDIEAFRLPERGQGSQVFGHGVYLSDTESVANRPVYKGPSGKAYEVQVAAEPHEFLDWHAPLSKQGETVQGALSKAGIEGKQKIEDGMPIGGGGVLRVENDPDFGPKYSVEASNGTRFRLSPADVANRFGADGEELTGQGAYARFLTAAGGDDAKAAQMMQEAGIKGVRYPDNIDPADKGAGAGGWNYAVFDPATIEILRKYGLAGLGLGTAAAAAQPDATP